MKARWPARRRDLTRRSAALLGLSSVLWIATLASVNASPALPPSVGGVTARATPLPLPAPSAPDAGPLPPNPTVTPWPSQAVHPAATPCSAPQLTAGSAQLVSVRLQQQGDQPLVIDPWSPCHVYLRNTSATRVIARSDDNGASYNTVLKIDNVSNTTTGSSVGALSTPGPGEIWTFDYTTSHVLFKSQDYGAHWTQYGTDLPIVSNAASGCAVCVEALSFAPSDHDVAYAALGSSGTATIFRSSDGGKTWSLAGAPGWMNQRTRQPIVVDPRTARHLYFLGGVSTGLLESRNGGATWLPVNTPNNNPDNLLVGATGALYLEYGNANPPSSSPTLAASFDDGANWTSVQVPIAGLSSWSVALDPSNDSRGLFTGVTEDARGWVLMLADTTDGFRTVGSVRSVVLSKPAPSSPCPPSDCAVQVTADRSGDFYVDALAGTGSGSSSGNLDVIAEFLVAVRLPLATLPAVSSVVPVGAAGGTGGGSSSGQPVGGQYSAPNAPVPAPLAKTCQLPEYVPPSTATGSPPPSGGTLAYDGRSLLYTDPGDDSTLPDTAIIRKFDPVTCSPTGVILVRFRTADLLTARDPKYPPVEIESMAYDARRQVLWATLRDQSHRGTAAGVSTTGLQSSAGETPALFTIHVTDPAPGPVEHAVATLAFAGGCELSSDLWLAYDFTSDTLLTCDANTPVQQSTGQGNLPLHKLDPASGQDVPSCLDGLYYQTSGAGLPFVGWTVTRPGEVYAEAEDDKTMVAIQIPETPGAACSLVRTYRHFNDIEPASEDEELACDSQTYSTSGNTVTVVWLRSTGDMAFSFYVPGGSCPLPTFTTYLGPSTLQAGAMTRFCASVSVHYLEGYQALPAGLPVTFSARGQVLGTAYTTGGLDVCTGSVRNPLPFGTYTVIAAFPGTAAYLPSSGMGPLTMPSATGAGTNQSGLAVTASAQAPPAPPGQPSGLSQYQGGAEQAQAQAQSEAQAQAQSQAQAQTMPVGQLQPGFVAQRQKRTQVAIQEQAAGEMNALQATALRRTVPGPIGALAAAFMTLVAGGLARRARPSVVRRTRPRPGSQ